MTDGPSRFVSSDERGNEFTGADEQLEISMGTSR